MHRAAISMILALTVLGSVFGSAPLRSAAQDSTPSAATPASFVGVPPEICTLTEMAGWESVAETPPGKEEWAVRPADSDPRILYFVVITLGPGKCIPFGSDANRKNGAVVLIVHEGAIQFTAQLNAAEPGAVVEFGDPDGPGEHPGTPVAFGTTIEVKPDQWVSQDRQVWFTYKNPDPVEDAVIWKAVWADPVPIEGCGGDCK